MLEIYNELGKITKKFLKESSKESYSRNQVGGMLRSLIIRADSDKENVIKPMAETLEIMYDLPSSMDFY